MLTLSEKIKTDEAYRKKLIARAVRGGSNSERAAQILNEHLWMGDGALRHSLI